MTETLRPYDVTSMDQLVRMQEDNFPRDADRFSILIAEDKVSIHYPRGGSGRAMWFEIPRDQFNAIVDWYLRPQVLDAEDPAR